jgi:hypothetical protein
MASQSKICFTKAPHVSQWIVDASLTLQWYLKDEQDRDYGLAVLAGLRENEAVVPFLWIFEVCNALVTAHRRMRIDLREIDEILDYNPSYNPSNRGGHALSGREIQRKFSRTIRSASPRSHPT